MRVAPSKVIGKLSTPSSRMNSLASWSEALFSADAHSVRVSAPSITSALRVDLGARKVS